MAKKKAAKKAQTKRGTVLKKAHTTAKKQVSAAECSSSSDEGSPRDQVKDEARKPAPRPIVAAIQKKLPGFNAKGLTWARAIAIAHLVRAIEGDANALREVYKQIDDEGVDHSEVELKESPRDRIVGKLTRIRKRKTETADSK